MQRRLILRLLASLAIKRDRAARPYGGCANEEDRTFDVFFRYGRSATAMPPQFPVAQQEINYNRPTAIYQQLSLLLIRK
ncbi:hypothetical protein [Microcoleus sp.]|uniref:hypothetical protein n=1 Tax=Microcoleus sp. TaxID=44472 RepID=UPI003593A989